MKLIIDEQAIIRGRDINLPTTVFGVYDQMLEYSELLEVCETKRERQLAYAIVLMDSIMTEDEKFLVPFEVAYEAMLQANLWEGILI